MSSAREHREVGSIREHRGSRQVWEAQGAYQERAKKTSKKGIRNGALARRCFDLAGESLVVLGKLWMYVIYPPDLGIGGYGFCGAGKGAYVVAWDGAAREHGGEH